jgi:hypothetical protein
MAPTNLRRPSPRQAIQDFQGESRAALKSEVEALAAQKESAEKQHKALVEELGKLEEQIRDSIRRATGYGLFSSFQTRQQQLVARL